MGDSEGMVTRGRVPVSWIGPVPGRPSPADTIPSSRGSRPPPTPTRTGCCSTARTWCARRSMLGWPSTASRWIPDRARRRRPRRAGADRCPPTAGHGQPLRARGDEPGAHAQRHRRAGGASAPRGPPTSCAAGRRCSSAPPTFRIPATSAPSSARPRPAAPRGVITTPGGADPFGWKAVRGAMGSAFRLPIVRASSAAEMVDLAQRRRPAGRAPPSGHGHTPMHDVDFTPATLIVLGSEGTGCRPTLVEAADVRVVDSHDAARRVAQRGGGGGAPGVRGATAAGSHNHEGTTARRHDDDAIGITLMPWRRTHTVPRRASRHRAIAPS